MIIFISIILFIISFFSASSGDYLFLSGWLVLFVNLVILCNRDKIKWNHIDICLCLFILFECIRAFWLCNYKSPTNSTLGIWLSSGMYFTIKLSSNSSQRRIFSCIYVVLLILVLLSFPPLIGFIADTQELNLENPIPYRFVVSCLGMGINQWASITIAISVIGVCGLLLLNPNPKTHLKRLMLAGLSTTAITVSLLSFSRGVYISLSVLLVLLVINFTFFKTKHNTNKILALLSLTVPVAIVYLLSPAGVTNTVMPNDDISQNRSAAGRITGAMTAYDLFINHPLTGVGSGRFGMASYLENESDGSQPAFPGNSLSQALAEKGLFGSLILILIVFFLIKGIITNKRNPIRTKFIICSCISVLCIREMSYPGIFNSTSQQTIWMFFLCFLSNYMDNRTINPGKRSRIIGSSAAILICSMLSFQSFGFRKEHPDPTTKENTDLYSLRSSFHETITSWSMYKTTSDICQLNSAFENIKKCIDKAPDDPVFLYNGILISKALGNNKFADSVRLSLSGKHPGSLLSRWIECTNNLSDTVPANFIDRVTSLIMTFPYLINTTEYQAIIRKYSIDEYEIKKIIEKKIKDNIQEENPVRLAYNGNLAFWIGNNTLSEYLLQKSIQKLPNLIIPHLILSEIYRDKGLQDNARKHETIYCFLSGKPNSSGTGIKNVTTLDDYYVSNFENWYGFSVNPDKIILN